MKLVLDWVDAKAASYACHKWHYSGAAPMGGTARIGVWEDTSFRGVVIFGIGSNRNIAKPFGLEQHEVCELSRVALREHKTAVSRIVAIALRMLKREFPLLQVVVSYADMRQGHLGVIYQAGNWTYVGTALSSTAMILFGRERHSRNIRAPMDVYRKADPNAKRIKLPPKHKYAYALNPEVKKQLAHMALPYPKSQES